MKEKLILKVVLHIADTFVTGYQSEAAIYGMNRMVHGIKPQHFRKYVKE